MADEPNAATEIDPGANEPAEVKPVTPETEKTSDIATKPTEAGKTAAIAVSTPTPHELEEKEVKQAFITRFRRKKKEGEGTLNKESGAMSTAGDELTEKLYREIAKTRGREYLVLRVKKRTVLVLLGVLVLLAWTYPMGKWLMSMGYLPFAENTALEDQQTDQGVGTDLGNGEGVDQRVKSPDVYIRVRDNGGDGLAQRLVDFMKGKGYQRVELVDDHESDYEGVNIVVKPNALDLRSEMEAILRDEYDVSSPSAELTDDSEVDVVVLFGLEREATGSAEVNR